ncbi:hypothetical protein CLV28_2069 [Sediminihabitans luteus]|uniref:YdbS-like PH domain-containing protein n=1 Tax=Sediminihabitans luteus TaxID=1138585 RepID=A0A2M9CEC9_9CELL|nr:PH domain-containing protein [Sediminihabitans luteus]PJJ70238.1 hypothetical protein CLV28_2069 [Sediminihabitans luteus]GII97709.1 membrane protein [Sediminihabitans luteus]
MDPQPTHPGPFDPAGVEWSSVSPRLVPARLLVVGIVCAVPVVVGALLAVLLSAPWWWLLAGVPAAVFVWSCVLVPRQVRATRYAERDDDLLIRRGIMFRSLVVVPYGRLQYVDVEAGPFAARFGIAKVQLHTASPATDAAVPGLPPAEAARLRDRLSERGQARLAGL